MTQQRNRKLIEACHNALLVKFWTPFEDGATEGYVLDIGPVFFLLANIGEELRFNGFQCLRMSDVRRLQAPSAYANFIEKALRKQGQILKKKPNIDLESLPALLKSANQLFPLVTVHREEVSPDTCRIGKVVEVTETHLVLHEIGPDAVWDKNASKLRLSDITRVDFGGGYETALHLVGGNPKSIKKSRHVGQL